MSNQDCRIARHVGLALVLSWGLNARASTYKPRSDDEVLTRVPTGGAAYERLRQDPKNLPLALEAAGRLVAQGRESADPRAYGQAEAALAPWWNETTPPLEVRLLRASVLQFNHRFAEALTDLDQYLKERPNDTDARLMQATVALVHGDLALARTACGALETGRSAAIKMTCSASVEAIAGDPGATYERVNAVVDYLAPADPKLQAWVRGTLGEIAARAGKPADAERHLKLALAAAPTDLFAAVTLADLYLGQGRNDEVIAMLAPRADQDALLLRLAVAEKRTGAKAAKAHAAELEERFRLEKERGSRPHLREEAYFALYVREDAASAAALAAENWKLQKEPIDARLVAEAAKAR